MAGRDDAERLACATSSQWRDWLEANHGRPEGVWLVTWKKRSGQPHLPYDDAVEQALCFGWIDSVPRKLDDERTMLWFAPRKKGSGWSALNKQRIERMRAAGLMAPAGEQAVAAAVADGSWTKLDAVDRLEVPDDLAAALETHGARATWDAFPPSARRGILEWIVQAKRSSTRAARVEEAAVKAARGERANQWPR